MSCLDGTRVKLYIKRNPFFSQARKDLHSLERTVDEMERERRSLENSLCQQNIKNTSLQDEINDLKRRNVNVENRYKSELEAEKEKVNFLFG